MASSVLVVLLSSKKLQKLTFTNAKKILQRYNKSRYGRCSFKAGFLLRKNHNGRKFLPSPFILPFLSFPFSPILSSFPFRPFLPSFFLHFLLPHSIPSFSLSPPLSPFLPFPKIQPGGQAWESAVSSPDKYAVRTVQISIGTAHFVYRTARQDKPCSVLKLQIAGLVRDSSLTADRNFLHPHAAANSPWPSWCGRRGGLAGDGLTGHGTVKCSPRIFNDRRIAGGETRSTALSILSLPTFIFTARRYASAVLATALCLSVCVSVCLSQSCP